MYATRNWFVINMYKDNYWLSEASCFFSPDSWFAWHVRGNARWEVQSYREASIMWVMAHMISPTEFKVLVNLATVLRSLKNNEEAERYLKIAEANIPLGQEIQASKLIADHRKGNCGILI